LTDQREDDCHGNRDLAGQRGWRHVHLESRAGERTLEAPVARWDHVADVAVPAHGARGVRSLAVPADPAFVQHSPSARKNPGAWLTPPSAPVWATSSLLSLSTRCALRREPPASNRAVRPYEQQLDPSPPAAVDGMTWIRRFTWDGTTARRS